MASSFRPNLDHLSHTVYSEIYGPSDDTFLFSDVLERERTTIAGVLPGLCVEVGPGTGYLTTHLASMFPSSEFLALDINPKACEVCQKTFEVNRLRWFDVLQADLMKCLLDETVDVVVFNPPYVPSEDDELGFSDIRAAYAGGERGRVVIDEFVDGASPKLRSGGLVYLLVIRENDPAEVMRRMESAGLVDACVVGEQKRGWEHQFILRARKP